MHSLYHARSFELVNCHSTFGAILRSVDQFYLARSWNLHLRSFIHITIGMTCQRDRFFPRFYIRLNAFYNDRRPEYGSIKDRTDGSVGTLPHFFQMILFHTGCIGRDGCAFHCYSIFFGRFCSINGDLIIGLISLFQSKIIILRLQINKRKKQFLFDHLPQDSGHLISVHLYQRCHHSNLFHGNLSSAL